MVGRRAVLQGAVGAVAGGVPAMRPDQALQPVSRSGTGPAPQNAFLVNPIIVVTPGKGLFIYSPSPGAGNLIASVAASAGTDPYGNPYPQGITSYGTTIEGIFNASTLSWQALSNPFNVQPSINGNGNSLTGADLALDSGAATPSTSVAAIDLEDSVRSGTGASLISMRAGQINVGPVAAAPPATAAQLEVQGTTGLKGSATPAAVAGFLLFYGTTAGTPAAVLPSGWQGELTSAPAADFTNFTVTAASATQCTKAWTIPANDAQVGTTYRLVFTGNGTQGSTVQGLTFQTSTLLAQAALPSSFGGVSGAFNWKVVIELTVKTTGAGGTCNVVTHASAGQGGTGDHTVTGFSSAAAFNTTIAQTLEGNAGWGSTTGAPTLTCFQSYVERVGP